MKKLLAFLLLVGCASGPTPKGFVPVNGGNTCLVDAISFARAVKADAAFPPSTWTAILGIEWLTNPGDTVTGHAVCLYEFDRAIWAYTSGFSLLPGGGSIHLLSFSTGDPNVTKNNPHYLATLFMGDSSLFRRAWFIQNDNTK